MKKKFGIASIWLVAWLLITVFGGCTTIPGDARTMKPASLELAELMGNGINLSNTMEAYGHLNPGIDKAPRVYETLWGQPVTTKQMLLAMKKAGFDSIRIPVAWTNTMDFENGNYSIAAAYLDRVEEIVNYALDADMYVIINDHWDGSWWGMFGSAARETREKGMKLYIAMWKQIAERFSDYSNKLIFESANEELGSRLNDANVAQDSGTLSEDECYQTSNKINQTFVDTIRSSGGNNRDRFLLIAGYNTNIEKTCDDRFVMPTDKVVDKLLISVHYYDPWTYCGTDSVTRWGSTNEHKDMNDSLAAMKKFTDKGYGVIIGEYGPGPVLSDGKRKENIADYLRNFIDNCDLYGYVPMLWDIGGYFNRTKLRIDDEEIAALFVKRSHSAQSFRTTEEISATARKSLEAALERSKSYKEAAPALAGNGKAAAWIMYSSNDWAITYSVGDKYNPNSKTDGVIAKDTLITEAGTYTVSLDFTGTAKGYANSLAFSALGISNGEILFPGYIITIKEVVINGEPYTLKGIPYTTSDDKICTRVNLYNGWVGKIPPEARTASGDSSNVSPVVIDNKTLGNVKSISITFDYGLASH